MKRTIMLSALLLLSSSAVAAWTPDFFVSGQGSGATAAQASAAAQYNVMMQCAQAGVGTLQWQIVTISTGGTQIHATATAICSASAGEGEMPY